MDNSRNMVEMHSSICEDIAGNSTNISPKRQVGGSNPLKRARTAAIIRFSPVYSGCFLLSPEGRFFVCGKCRRYRKTDWRVRGWFMRYKRKLKPNFFDDILRLLNDFCVCFERCKKIYSMSAPSGKWSKSILQE